MRSTVVKVAFTAISLSRSVFALDLAAYETQCADIGFKRKTQPFGECVLELRERGAASSRSSINAVSKGDGTPGHSTCSRYGFNAGTTEYSQCRMQIDLARSQAQEQQRQYETQIAEQQKAKENAQNDALIMWGLSMMAGGGQKPANTSNFNTIERPQMDRIYNLPGGKFMRCNTQGMVTNCQ